MQTKGCATIMSVTMPQKNPTDQRLDTLNQRVVDGFAEVHTKMDAGFERLDSDIRELRGEMRVLHRALYGSTAAIVIALLGSNALS